MTTLLERAIATIRDLPPDSQDEIARAMLRLAGAEGEPETIEPDHLAGLLMGLDDARQSAFATDDEVAAAFRRFER